MKLGRIGLMPSRVAHSVQVEELVAPGHVFWVYLGFFSFLIQDFLLEGRIISPFIGRIKSPFVILFLFLNSPIKGSVNIV